MIPATDDPAADWTAPGVYRVLPGVHRIPLPLPNDGLRAVNVYAIEDGDGLVLVDAGWALAESRDRLRGALRGLGCDLGDVRRFLVTHIHRDHYTQAVALRREFGSRISLGSGEEPSLRAAADERRRHNLDTQVELLRRHGAAPVAEAIAAAIDGRPRNAHLWERPDDWVNGGTDVPLRTRTLRAVSTPGHTRGHLVFVEGDAAACFSGDCVLPHITPSIGFEPVLAELPLRDYLNSLRKLRTMPDTRLLPAHGPVADSVHARIDELLAHHDTRLEAARRTVSDGASTAYQAARMLPWTRRGRAFDDLDPFNQMLAVAETAAHLDLLVAQGRLRSADGSAADDGVITYAAS